MHVPNCQPYGMREIVVTAVDGHRLVFGQDLEDRFQGRPKSPVRLIAQARRHLPGSKRYS
jgi:hypothetical protein